MYVKRISVRRGQPDRWPFTMAPVRQLTAGGLAFERPVTFLVGENASGKSTIVEAIADVCKISSDGGKAGTKYSSTGGRTALGAVLEAEFTPAGYQLISGPRRKRQGFFLRAETLHDLAQSLKSVPYGFWDADLDEQSHGEGFFTACGSWACSLT